MGDAARVPLKDYLKTALSKAAQERQASDDVQQLERLEDKLIGALEEVRARKAELQQSGKRGDSK